MVTPSEESTAVPLGAFPRPIERRLFYVLNFVLAWVLAWMHCAHSMQFLNWRELISFQGGQPFQGRVLIFLVARAIDKSWGLSDADLQRLFFLVDFVGALLFIFF